MSKSHSALLAAVGRAATITWTNMVILPTLQGTLVCMYRYKATGRISFECFRLGVTLGRTGEGGWTCVKHVVIHFLILDFKLDANARHQLSDPPTSHKRPATRANRSPMSKGWGMLGICVAPSACYTAHVDEAKEQWQDGLARGNIRCLRGFR